MRKSLILGVILTIIGMSIIFLFGSNIMGAFGYGNASYTYVNNSFLNNLQKGANVRIDKGSNTIKFLGSKITIPIIASPENASMYSFGVYGLVNPTIIVGKNAQITIQLINRDDDMYHGVMVTVENPPYPYMRNMMFNQLAFKNSYVVPLPLGVDNKYPKSSTTFIADKMGNFYYICQVLGHASKGMYGKFIVSNEF